MSLHCRLPMPIVKMPPRSPSLSLLPWRTFPASMRTLLIGTRNRLDHQTRHPSPHHGHSDRVQGIFGPVSVSQHRVIPPSLPTRRRVNAANAGWKRANAEFTNSWESPSFRGNRSKCANAACICSHVCPLAFTQYVPHVSSRDGWAGSADRNVAGSEPRPFHACDSPLNAAPSRHLLPVSGHRDDRRE